jgi:hypothetical protein
VQTTLAKVFIPLVLASSMMAACGGGDGGAPAAAAPPVVDLKTAEGLWNGTTGTGRRFSGLVLDDGTYWFLYTAVGNDAVLGGAVQGNGTSSAGKFSSSNGIDFNLEGLGINDFTLAGTYTASSKLGGTLTYASNATNTFTSTYDTDYDLVPAVATVAGTYTGTGVTATSGAEAATATITSGGTINGTSAFGCSFTGTAAARSKGNVYNVSVTFSGGDCANGNATVTGVAYYIASQRGLVVTALNGARTNGFIFEGVKP